MSKDPITKIVDSIISDKTIKKAGIFITNVVSIMLSFISALFFASSALFVILGLTTSFPLFFGLSIFLVIPAIFILVVSINLKKGNLKNYSKKHFKEIKDCENILQRVKDHLKNEKISRNEYKHIYGSMKKELKNAKDVAKKIDVIIKALRSPDYSINAIESRIKEEENKDPKNEAIIKTLKEQVKNIKKLEERVKDLQDHISNLKLNFNSIFTKVTLLGTESKVGIDDVETEIQKILNFKMNVAKFEEELAKELEQ